MKTTSDQLPPRPKKSRAQRQKEVTQAKLARLREDKTAARHQLTVAQASTKSMGRFDPKAHKKEKTEKPRRKKTVPILPVEEEKARNLDVLARVLAQEKFKKVQHSM
jgi:hypothetical protein